VPNPGGLHLGGGIGGLLHLNQGGAPYSYLYDGKGNVTALLDGVGHVAAVYQYDPFGVPRGPANTLSQPMQFSTKPYDEKTGLSFYGFRFYAPALGRWMTRDPIGEAGGINLYGFVGNNAVNWADPLGLIWRTISVSSTNYSMSNWGWRILNRFIYSGPLSNDIALGTQQDVWQTWQPDPENPDRDSEYPMRTQRKIPQRWCRNLKFPGDQMLIDPKNSGDYYYYGWNPLVGSSTYENYPGQTIHLENKSQGK
jgi:RHS repeat-associated protein